MTLLTILGDFKRGQGQEIGISLLGKGKSVRKLLDKGEVGKRGKEGIFMINGAEGLVWSGVNI